MAWKELFSTDIGLLSLFTIGFILVMGGYLYNYAKASHGRGRAAFSRLGWRHPTAGARFSQGRAHRPASRCLSGPPFRWPFWAVSAGAGSAGCAGRGCRGDRLGPPGRRGRHRGSGGCSLAAGRCSWRGSASAMPGRRRRAWAMHPRRPRCGDPAPAAPARAGPGAGQRQGFVGAATARSWLMPASSRAKQAKSRLTGS